jgi:hypothetical protein
MRTANRENARTAGDGETRLRVGFASWVIRNTDPHHDGSAANWHHGAVENWEIKSVVAVSPTNADESDAAYLLKVAYGDEEAEVVVEFAAPSSVASGGYAEEVVRRFLGHDEPPQRVLVERDGSVRVATSPLTTERAPRSTSTSREPQRARRRGLR